MQCLIESGENRFEWDTQRSVVPSTSGEEVHPTAQDP